MRRFEMALEKIQDESVRESLDVLAGEMLGSAFGGFRGRHFEIAVEAGTYDWLHRLGFVPRDVLQTSLRVSSGTATWSWNYSDFTKDYLNFTVTTSVAGAVATVRAFIGRYGES